MCPVFSANQVSVKAQEPVLLVFSRLTDKPSYGVEEEEGLEAVNSEWKTCKDY